MLWRGFLSTVLDLNMVRVGSGSGSITEIDGQSNANVGLIYELGHGLLFGSEICQSGV